MRLRERVALALVRGLAPTLASIPPQSAGGQLLARIFPGSIGQPPRRGSKEMLNAYSEYPWLRAVENRIGDAIASVEWKLYTVSRAGQASRALARPIQRAATHTQRKSLMTEREDIGELKQIPVHPFLDALDAANPFLTGLSLRKLTQIYLDLLGECFWLKERNGVGAPVGFWPIPPTWILNTPTPRRLTYRVSFAAWQGEIPETEIFHFKDPDPSNPYGRGSGTAKALGDEFDTDEYAAKMLKAHFFNNGQPGFIAYPKGDQGVNQPEMDRWRQDWLNQHQGFWKAFKPMLASREIGIHEFGQDFRSMQLVQLRKHERDTIIQVTGLPPEMLGIIENSNRSTIDAGEYIFGRWVLVPRLEFLRAFFQERLIPEYDDRLIVEYASPVTEDKAYQLEVAKAAPWALTVNEWRQRSGEEPLEGDAGEVHLVPTLLSPTLDLAGDALIQPPSDPLSELGVDEVPA